MSVIPPKRLMSSLTKADLKRAIRGDTAEHRANAVLKIGRAIRAQSLTSEDRVFAEKILSFICRDVSDLVRRALSVTLQNSPNLPRSIARLLIEDIDSIAVPVLAHSPVITDDDIVAVLRSRAAAKVKAVAQRQNISEAITRAIVSFGDSAAVADMAANDHAIISEETAAHIAQLYGEDDLIREAALSRQDMPLEVVRKLIGITTHKARRRLEKTDGMSDLQAKDISQRVHERALLDYTDKNWPEKTLTLYVDKLHEEELLGEDLMLRAAGQGDMRFVQLAFAKLCGVNVAKSAMMLFDPGPLGLKVLCKNAGLSLQAEPFLRAALAVYRDFQVSGRSLSAAKMQTLMLERILTLPIELNEETALAFCEKLDSLNQLRVV